MNALRLRFGLGMGMALCLVAVRGGRALGEGWPAWRADLRRTGAVRGTLEPGVLGVRIRLPVLGAGRSLLFQPTAGGEVSFAVAASGRVVARRLDGVLRWSRPAEGVLGCESLPALLPRASGRDLLCRSGSRAWILDGRSGEVRWSTPPGLLRELSALLRGGAPDALWLAVAGRSPGGGAAALHLFAALDGAEAHPRSSASTAGQDGVAAETLAVETDGKDRPLRLLVAGRRKVYGYPVPLGGAAEESEDLGNLVPGHTRLRLWRPEAATEGEGAEVLVVHEQAVTGAPAGLVLLRRTEGVLRPVFELRPPGATALRLPTGARLPNDRLLLSWQLTPGGPRVDVVVPGEGAPVVSFPHRTILASFLPAFGAPILWYGERPAAEMGPGQTWIQTWPDTPRQAGTRLPPAGMVRLDRDLFGRPVRSVPFEGLVPGVRFDPDEGWPVAIDGLDARSAFARVQSLLPAPSAEVRIHETTEPLLLVHEVDDRLRVLRPGEASPRNPASADLDPAPRAGGLLPAEPVAGAGGAPGGPPVLFAAGRGTIHAHEIGRSASLWAKPAWPSPRLLLTEGDPGEPGSLLLAGVLPEGRLAVRLLGADGRTLWTSEPAEAEVTGHPLLADVNGDGLRDAIVPIRDGEGRYRVWVLDGADGTSMGTATDLGGGADTLPALALLDEDPPAAVAVMGARLLRLDLGADGAAILAGAELPAGARGGTPIAVAPPTPSGVAVVVAGGPGGVFAFDGDLALVWGREDPSLSGARAALGGQPASLVLGSGADLFCLKVEDGATRWTWGSEAELGAPALAVDPMGRGTVVLADAAGLLHLLDLLDGALLGEAPTGSPGGDVALSDVDGDGRLEVLLPGGDAAIRVLDRADLAPPRQVWEISEISGAGDPEADIDDQEDPGALVLAWSPVEGALGYRITLVTTDGTEIMETRRGDAPPLRFEGLDLPLDVQISAEVQTLGPQAASAPTRSDGIRIQDRSPPEIGPLRVNQVEDPGALPAAGSLRLRVVATDRTALRNAGLEITDADGGGAIGRVEHQDPGQRAELTLTLSEAEVPAGRRIRIEARASDRVGREVRRVWTLQRREPVSADAGTGPPQAGPPPEQASCGCRLSGSQRRLLPGGLLILAILVLGRVRIDQRTLRRPPRSPRGRRRRGSRGGGRGEVGR